MDAVVSSHTMRLRRNQAGKRWLLPKTASIPAFGRMSAADLHQTQASEPVPRRRLEEDLQIECAKWLETRALSPRLPIRFMFHPPNGGRRSKTEAGRFKAMGVKGGVPDWLCPIRWRGWLGLAIEMKAGCGRLSADQAAWMEGLEEAGYLVGQARSLDDFIRLVERYLDGRPDHRP